MLYPPREVERPVLPQFSVRTLLFAVAAFALLLAAVPAIRQYLLMRHIRSRVPTAETSLGAGRAYDYALPRLTERNLKRLEADDNIGIALRAAYQTIERQNQRWQQEDDALYPLTTLTKERQRQIERRQGIHQALAKEFLEFLEQRSGLDAPDWWEERIELSSIRNRPLWSEYRVRVEDGKITLPDGEQITIGPKVQAVLEDDAYLTGQSFRLITFVDDRTFLVPYDYLGWRSPVLCIDSESGELIWRSENWALGWENLMNFRGMYGAAYIKAELHGGTLVIWFAGDRGEYLETFDAETGTSLYRFSTSLWCAR